jgi:hypothetical protein
VDRRTTLLAIFENKALDFSKNRADGVRHLKQLPVPDEEWAYLELIS